MAAHFFDIDGTLLHYHTGKWLVGAKEYVCSLYHAGDQIILMTMRGEQDNGTEWSIENTKATILKDLDDAGVKYTIIFGVDSPRYMHDDSECVLNKRATNQEWC